MTERFRNMDASDLAKLIDYIVKYDTGSKTVGDIRKELYLTREEFDELYNLAIPAIRGFNEGRFWKTAYVNLETGIGNVIAGKKAIEKKLSMVSDILKCKSLRRLKEERLKGWVTS